MKRFKRVSILLLGVLLLLSGCRSVGNSSEPEVSYVTEYEYVTETIENSDTAQKETSSDVHKESSSMVEPPKTDIVDNQLPEEAVESVQEKTYDNDWTLIINGIDVSSKGPIYKDEETGEMVFSVNVIAEAYGATVTWNGAVLEMRKGEKFYVIDTEAEDFGLSHEYLRSPYSEPLVRNVIDGHVMLETRSARKIVQRFADGPETLSTRMEEKLTFSVEALCGP